MHFSKLSNFWKPVYCILLLLILNTAVAAERPAASAVASAHPLATQAGQEILAAGGNAFDAAVAVTAVLAVVEPAGSGLGGGGFWLLHRQKDNFSIMIDGREVAPAAANRTMYLDSDGKFIRELALNGPLAAGIPGVPAAIDHLAGKYGKLPLSKSLAPAIRHAEQGFKTSKHYHELIKLRHSVLLESAASTDIFLDDGMVPEPGFVLKQPDLANTLRALAKQGRKGFYQGKIAKLMVKAVRQEGGIWKEQDLHNYRIVERKPVTGTYKGFKITSASLPSSGGIVMMQILNLLEPYKLKNYPRWQRDHLVIEAMRLAYRDRARYLGDSDFVSVDSGKLVSRAYADKQRKAINKDKAGTSDPATVAPVAKGQDTTHFSIIDQQGNRVAATLSINFPFGSGFTPPGTGVILNNEMDDFSAKPGTPNVYGLVGSHANAIQPGKRPLSSMSPTFIESDDIAVAIGTPGGSRIISMVTLAVLEIAEKRGKVSDWVALPRFHHQFLPDQVIHELDAFNQKEIKQLQKAGHKLKARKGTYGNMRKATYGNMHAVSWNKKNNKVEAASDPRGEGMGSVKAY
jgi:gamma-glutamyltranspeptidase/glutathione hydrolase